MTKPEDSERGRSGRPERTFTVFDETGTPVPSPSGATDETGAPVWTQQEWRSRDKAAGYTREGPSDEPDEEDVPTTAE